MNNHDLMQMVKDIAYIKGKVEGIPDLQDKVDCHAIAISKMKGVLSALSIYGTLILPLVISVLGYFLGKKPT
jgi:hypothetical protein